ncbi:uncharacterized protein LOC9650958 [Selaginella moellendorffii]|nr:uncharacterized protein LOC9650958 [Selaginella moellendorffii]|eukprot:XP_024529691.1 uncharacterized protein LOC9650958 [Selaginella moellendorffii]
MPINPEDHHHHHRASPRLPTLRQVLGWIDKKPKEQESELATTDRLFHLFEEEERGKEMASSAAAFTTILPAAKCPYSAVAKNPAVPYVFQMPLHYPRYTKAEYEAMPEWQLDRLFEEYGLSALITGALRDKRDYAIGAFLWK